MQPENPDVSESSINIKSNEQKKSQRSTRPLDTVEGTHVGTPKPEYRVKRTMRFPFWEIQVSRGRQPEILSGRYTEKSVAIKAIQLYDPEATIKIIEG